MAKNINYVSHKKSKVKLNNGKPQLPLASALVEGELAINYAENVETLSIKNESGTVVTFSSDDYYTQQKLGDWFSGETTVTDVIKQDERIVAAALNDLNSTSIKGVRVNGSALTPDENRVVDVVVPQSLRIMGGTPQGHTLADTKDIYYANQLNEGEAGAWFITYSDGNMLFKPEGTSTDENGRIKLSDSWKSTLNYDGMTWANVGDILLVYKYSSLIVAYKVLALNEAGETRIGLMSPNDKKEVNKISGIETQLSNRLYYSSGSTNIGNASDGAYTNVTAGRTNWIDTSTRGAAIKLGDLQIAVDNSGRLYSRNQTANGGVWNLTNQLMTIGGTDLDTVYVPSVVGYGVCQNGPEEASGNPLTVYSITSADVDGNGYRSILQVAIDRTTSKAYMRTTFYNPSNSNFTKTDWVDMSFKDEYDAFTAATDSSIDDLSGQSRTIAAALNVLNDSKVSITDFTSHVNSPVHMSAAEKNNLDLLGDNIDIISGITSTQIDNWDDANDKKHVHDNQTYLDGIDNPIGTMAYQNTSSYSSATQVRNALSKKADKTVVNDLVQQTETIAAAFNDLNEAIDEKSKVVAISLNDLNQRVSDQDEIVAASLNDLNGKINGLSNTKANASDVEELEQILTAAIADINERMAENLLVTALVEQIRVLSERVGALEAAAQQ